MGKTTFWILGCEGRVQVGVRGAIAADFRIREFVRGGLRNQDFLRNEERRF